MSDYEDVAFGMPTAEEIKNHLLRTKPMRTTRQTIGAFPSDDLDLQESNVVKCDNLSALIEDVSKLSIPSQYFTPNETFQKAIPKEEFYTPNDTLQTSIKHQEFIEKVSQILNNTETTSPTPPNKNEFCEVLETSSDDINLSNIIEKLDAHIEECSRDAEIKDDLQTNIICLSDDDDDEDDVEFAVNNDIKEEADLSRYACLQSKYEDISGIAENVNEVCNATEILKNNFEEADSVVFLNTSDEGSDQSELEQNSDDSSDDSNVLMVDMSRDSLDRENYMQLHNRIEAKQVQEISNDVDNICSPIKQNKYLLSTEQDANSSLTSLDENQKIYNSKNLNMMDDFNTSEINDILPLSREQRQNVSFNNDFNTSEVSEHENEEEISKTLSHNSSTNEHYQVNNHDFNSSEMAGYGREQSSCSGYCSNQSKSHGKSPKDISECYSYDKLSTLPFDDTISEMEKALAMGLDYSSSEEEKSSSEPTVNCEFKKTTKSQIPLLTPKFKPDKFDHIISPVANYIKKSPTQFKLPQPVVPKKRTPTPHKYTSTVYKDIKSPVMLYIKNSPAAPLQQKIATNKLTISQTLFPTVNKKPGEMSLPDVAYKPARKVVNHNEKESKLPECIENLIPYRPKVIRHEKKINQVTGQKVQRKLMDNNLTVNADYSINGQDISIHVTKEPLRK